MQRFVVIFCIAVAFKSRHFSSIADTILLAFSGGGTGGGQGGHAPHFPKVSILAPQLLLLHRAFLYLFLFYSY